MLHVSLRPAWLPAADPGKGTFVQGKVSDLCKSILGSLLEQGQHILLQLESSHFWKMRKLLASALRALPDEHILALVSSYFCSILRLFVLCMLTA